MSRVGTHRESVGRSVPDDSARPRAVIFDVDGLLVESEEYWDEARRTFVAEHGGGWTRADQKRVMGANSAEWAGYIRERFGIERPPEQIISAVQERVRALSERYSLAVASSAPRLVIEAVLDHLGVRPQFQAVVSADKVPRGKPEPDVYLEVARRLGVDPTQAVAFEDSENGVRAAKAAGMRVVAVPNRGYASPGGFEQADLVLASLEDFRPELLPALFERGH
jgi:HAD superfamily hydrolase (TIGR01509 family)